MATLGESRASAASSRLPDLVRRHSSSCLALFAIGLFLLCLWLFPVGSSLEARGQWLSELLRLYGFASSDDQRRAHAVTVAAVAILSLLVFRLGKNGAVANERWRIVRAFSTPVALCLVALGLFFLHFLIPRFIVLWAAVLSVACIAFVTAAPHVRTATLDQVVLALGGVYVAVVAVPGLFVSPIPIMEIDPNALAQFETHLFHVPMRGSAIAAGQKFFSEISLTYGLLMPSIMSVEAKRYGLSIADQLRYVQACQVLFCISAALAYLAYSRRSGYVGVLAVLCMAGPYWSSAGLGIWHQNQTGFRSLFLPLGLLALMLTGRLSPARAAWWLGVVAGAAFLMNLETAVALAAGFVVFLVARTRAVPWRPLLLMALGAALVVALWLLIYRIALGRSAFSTQSLDLLAMIRRFSGGGYGLRLFVAGHEGEGYYLVPLALIMFTHAIYVVIDGARKLGRAALPLRTALRMSVAVTLIAWLAYYFNAPNWWQIWTHFFLYGFLLLDLLDRRRFGVGLHSPIRSPAARFMRTRIAPSLLVTLFFLALLIPHTNRHLLKYTADFMYPRWLGDATEVSVLSGVLLPRDQARLLERKANRLKKLHAASKGELLYFTFNIAFMPQLTGLFQPPPYRDMFGEIEGDAAFDVVLENLLARRPDVILVDDPQGPLAVSGARRDFQERLRKAIAAAYRVEETDDGWEIWRPVRDKLGR